MTLKSLKKLSLIKLFNSLSPSFLHQLISEFNPDVLDYDVKIGFWQNGDAIYCIRPKKGDAYVCGAAFKLYVKHRLSHMSPFERKMALKK